MNASIESIPAEFSPETAFPVTLRGPDEPPTPTSEPCQALRLLPDGYEFTRRGIPDSARNP